MVRQTGHSKKYTQASSGIVAVVLSRHAGQVSVDSIGMIRI